MTPSVLRHKQPLYIFPLHLLYFSAQLRSAKSATSPTLWPITTFSRINNPTHTHNEPVIMPPKRAKAAAAAIGPVSASQPEPQRPKTRAPGRKRRHSDASNVSDAPSEISNTSSKAVRRSKRQLVTEFEQEVITEEPEEALETESSPPKCNGLTEQEQEQDEDDIEVSHPSKRVRFNKTESEITTETTATHITPHPRQKFTLKRRTLSTGKMDNVKRVKASRTSLPPSLSQESMEATQTVSEFTFSPFHKVVESRMQERKQSSPGGRIDDDDEEMEDDTLVLDRREEAIFIQPTTAPLTPITNGDYKPSEAGAVSKRLHSLTEEERERLNDAILALERESNDAKAKYRILAYQIDALGFAGDDAAAEPGDEDATKLILKSIRDSFDEIRDFLAVELPGSTPDDASNQDLLSSLRANVKEFADRLRNANKEAIENAGLTTDLANQVDHLLTRIADEKLKNVQLSKDSKISIERLTTSLKEYVATETRLKELITKMEDEHRETFAKMNEERETTVRGLEGQVDTATTLVDDGRGHIEELRKQLETVEAERDGLGEQLQTAREDLDAEADAKEDTQADLVAKTVEVEDLQDRVDALDDNIEELNSNLETLRGLNQTERQQREAAETDLDERNQHIEELEQKLRNGGKEANELRVKIYELQNRTTALEDEAAQREQQYESDLAAEVNRREGATGLAEKREKTITQLRGELADVQKRVGDLITERDERIANLDDELARKDVEMQGLEEEYKTDLEQKDSTIAELRDTVDELEGTNQRSQEQVADYETAVHDYEIAIADLQGQVASLQQDKKSLEGRVDKEASDMLVIQNSLGDEIKGLKAQLEERQEKLRVVHEKRAEEVKAMEELREAREAEVTTLTITHEKRVEVLQGDLEELKRQFAAFVRESHDHLVQRQAERHERLAELDEEDEELKATFLKRLEALKAPSTPPTTIVLQQQQQVVTRPQRKRKRPVDSGIGLEREALREEMVGA